VVRAARAGAVCRRGQKQLAGEQVEQRWVLQEPRGRGFSEATRVEVGIQRVHVAYTYQGQQSSDKKCAAQYIQYLG
jgi:hypothetical protein